MPVILNKRMLVDDASIAEISPVVYELVYNGILGFNTAVALPEDTTEGRVLLFKKLCPLIADRCFMSCVHTTYEALRQIQSMLDAIKEAETGNWGYSGEFASRKTPTLPMCGLRATGAIYVEGCHDIILWRDPIVDRERATNMARARIADVVRAIFDKYRRRLESAEALLGEAAVQGQTDGPTPLTDAEKFDLEHLLIRIRIAGHEAYAPKKGLAYFLVHDSEHAVANSAKHRIKMGVLPRHANYVHAKVWTHLGTLRGAITSSLHWKHRARIRRGEVAAQGAGGWSLYEVVFPDGSAMKLDDFLAKAEQVKPTSK